MDTDTTPAPDTDTPAPMDTDSKSKPPPVPTDPRSKMDLRFCHVTSFAGFKFDLLKSILQKAVRSNNGVLAKWAAVEWALFAEGPAKQAKGIIGNLRNRLHVIFLEDVGIGNLPLLKIILPMIDKVRYENGPQVIADAAWGAAGWMAASPGCRMPSLTQSIFKIHDDPDFKRRLEPYMDSFPGVKKMLEKLDKAGPTTHDHVQLLKQAITDKDPIAITYARWVLNPWEEKNGKIKRANNKFAVNQPMYSVLRGHPVIDSKLAETCIKLYASIKNKDAWQAIVTPIIAAIFPHNEDLVDYDYDDPDITTVADLEQHKNKAPTIENIPDECIDMHSKYGTKQGFTKNSLKGITRWCEKGIKIDQEYTTPCTVELYNFYRFAKYLSVGEVKDEYIVAPLLPLRPAEKKLKKRKSPGRSKSTNSKRAKFTLFEPEEVKGLTSTSMKCAEADLFEDSVRVHIPTGDAKQDCFITRICKKTVHFDEQEEVFVKGPYPCDSEVFKTMAKLNRAKKKMGFQTVNFEVLRDVFVSDTFAEETDTEGLTGYRYTAKPVLGAFIVFELLIDFPDDKDLVPYGSLKKHKSEGWKAAGAVIVNTSHLKQLKWKEHAPDDDLRFEYVCNLYFRALFGIVDHASRNFLVIDEHIVGVDEENMAFNTDIKLGNHTAKSAYIVEHWDDEFDAKIINVLESWVKPASKLGCIDHLRRLIADPKQIFQ